MSRPFLWLLVALLASPAVAFGIYRLAKELGFLDPPVDRQHELRRTIIVSLYTFLLFLPVAIYGFEKGWPRIWILFGIVDLLAILFFGAGGIWATIQLWKLRHPRPQASTIPEPQESFGATDVEGEGGQSSEIVHPKS